MKYIETRYSGPLNGTVHIPGAKNSALAILAAACLADDVVTLEGIPRIDDVRTVERIGRAIGMRFVVSVDNLFDSRQRVRDAAGNTPVSYQPDYLDPLGRTIRIGIRKLLF